MKTLQAWLHYKKLQPLNEDDAAFVADVESILSENARLREALKICNSYTGITEEGFSVPYKASLSDCMRIIHQTVVAALEGKG